MTTTVPARPPLPAQPIAPRPLWERHALFQEPDLPAGLDLIEDDEDPAEEG